MTATTGSAASSSIGILSSGVRLNFETNAGSQFTAAGDRASGDNGNAVARATGRSYATGGSSTAIGVHRVSGDNGNAVALATGGSYGYTEGSATGSNIGISTSGGLRAILARGKERRSGHRKPKGGCSPAHCDGAAEKLYNPCPGRRDTAATVPNIARPTPPRR